MNEFNKQHFSDLKQHLYQYYGFHDAQIKNTVYDNKKKVLEIDVYNMYLKKNISIVFKDVKVLLFEASNWLEDTATVSSLTVENDYSAIQKKSNISQDITNNSIYLFLEMVSGDILHIFADSVAFVEQNVD